MSYAITTTAGATLSTITDGTVNSTATSLTLIGKNYAGYGIFLNENYIKLLENFYNSSAPSAPLPGQLWYDSTNALLKVYNGSLWKPISSSASGSSQPASPITGDLWYDSVNAQLKVWSGSAFITVGPSYTTTSGTSGAVVETILDNASASHVVVKFYISNTATGILSKDATFTPGIGISGFTTIIPGFNLASSIAGAQFTGTVSTAATLSGITSSQFLRSDQAATSSYAVGVGQLNIGSDLTVTTSAGHVSIRNVTSDRDLNFWVNDGGVDYKAMYITGSTGVVTIPGTLTATASSAKYADLAERFESDATYQPGTVVKIGGVKEITAADQELSEAVFGVISTCAAYLMNSDAGDNDTHPAVAITGRVPVRVVGKVSKGDRLVSAGRGLARSALRSEITAFNVIGRSLENKETEDESMVEAIVKLNS